MATYRAFDPSCETGGRKRTAEVREVVNGIMYVLSTGCQWRYLPKDLPPKSTVYRYFDYGLMTARWRPFITHYM
jgi:transposase